MSTSVTIPIAGFKDVYDVPGVERALQDLAPSANEALRAIYEKMLRLGGQRVTVKPSALAEMEDLFRELPNFATVLEDIRKHLALCVNSNDSIELPPMLLLGEPGIGKTHFARKLAQLLGTGFGFVPMSSLTAGWVLSGASSQWKNAKPGKVFDTFLNGEYANPVIVVDELDKASSDGQYDPLGAARSAPTTSSPGAATAARRSASRSSRGSRRRRSRSSRARATARPRDAPTVVDRERAFQASPRRSRWERSPCGTPRRSPPP